MSKIQNYEEALGNENTRHAAKLLAENVRYTAAQAVVEAEHAGKVVLIEANHLRKVAAIEARDFFLSANDQEDESDDLDTNTQVEDGVEALSGQFSGAAAIASDSPIVAVPLLAEELPTNEAQSQT